MPDPSADRDTRRANTLIGWLLLAVSLPAALGQIIPAFIDMPRLFWNPEIAVQFGWRLAEALGVVFNLICWFLRGWGLLVPPLLAVLAVTRVLSARRAVVWTTAYIVIALVVRLFWMYLPNQGRPRIAVLLVLDQFVRAVIPGLVPIALTWYRWPARGERPWRWILGVTRIVLICLGVPGLLLIGLLLRSGVLQPMGRGGYQPTTFELLPYYARHGVQAAAYVVQLACAWLLLRHGAVRRGWLWLATAGAVLVWALSSAHGLVLEGFPRDPYPASREVWFLVQGSLASLAAAAGVLLWYWWPVLVGRVQPQLADGPLCPKCGYNLTGNVSGRCPECGSALPNAPAAAPDHREPARPLQPKIQNPQSEIQSPAGSETPPPVRYAATPEKPRALLAILAFGCGVISVPAVLYLFLAATMISVFAIVLGSIALAASRAQPQRHGGRGLAIAGISLGFLSLVMQGVIVANLHSSAL